MEVNGKQVIRKESEKEVGLVIPGMTVLSPVVVGLSLKPHGQPSPCSYS